MANICRMLKNKEFIITQNYSSSHIAIDIVGKNYSTDTILAHSDGIVDKVQTGRVNNQGSTGDESYGNYVKIDHGNGWYTLYAHLDKVYVKLGQKVTKGQEIGYMGNTGNSYGAHLHFEVWENWARTNPAQYFNADLGNAIKLPTPIKRNEKIDQFEVLYNDTCRVRTNYTLDDKNVIGLAKKGFYNVVSKKLNANGYNWYEVEKGKWVAEVKDVSQFLPKYEPKQEIVEEPKEQPTENTQNKADTELKEENNINNQEQEKNETQDKKQSVFVWILDLICKLIKLIKKN